MISVLLFIPVYQGQMKAKSHHQSIGHHHVLGYQAPLSQVELPLRYSNLTPPHFLGQWVAVLQWVAEL